MTNRELHELIAGLYDGYSHPMNQEPLERRDWEPYAAAWEGAQELMDSACKVCISWEWDNGQLAVFGLWPRWHPAHKVVVKLRAALAARGVNARLWDDEASEL